MELLGGYLCGLCNDGVIFHTKNDIQTHHANVHGPVRYRCFSCSICFKTFHDGSGIKKHLANHLEGKPYTCAGCPMVFKKADQVRQHLESVHGVISAIPCHLCVQKFPSQGSVESHVQSKHNAWWRNFKAQSSQSRGSTNANSQLGAGQPMSNFGASTSKSEATMPTFGATASFPGPSTSNSGAPMPNFQAPSSTASSGSMVNFGATYNHGGTAYSFGAPMHIEVNAMDLDTEMGGDPNNNSVSAGDGTSAMEY